MVWDDLDLAEIVTDVFQMGKWENTTEMEEKINLDELYAFHASMMRTEYRRNRFAAALKGINLDEEMADHSSFEEVQNRANAELMGKSQDEYVFDMIGISVDTEDE